MSFKKTTNKYQADKITCHVSIITNDQTCIHFLQYFYNKCVANFKTMECCLLSENEKSLSYNAIYNYTTIRTLLLCCQNPMSFSLGFKFYVNIKWFRYFYPSVSFNFSPCCNSSCGFSVYVIVYVFTLRS